MADLDEMTHLLQEISEENSTLSAENQELKAEVVKLRQRIREVKITLINTASLLTKEDKDRKETNWPALS